MVVALDWPVGGGRSHVHHLAAENDRVEVAKSQPCPAVDNPYWLDDHHGGWGRPADCTNHVSGEYKNYVDCDCKNRADCDSFGPGTGGRGRVHFGSVCRTNHAHSKIRLYSLGCHILPESSHTERQVTAGERFSAHPR